MGGSFDAGAAGDFVACVLCVAWELVGDVLFSGVYDVFPTGFYVLNLMTGVSCFGYGMLLF